MHVCEKLDFILCACILFFGFFIYSRILKSSPPLWFIFSSFLLFSTKNLLLLFSFSPLPFKYFHWPLFFLTSFCYFFASFEPISRKREGNLEMSWREKCRPSPSKHCDYSFFIAPIEHSHTVKLYTHLN